MLTYHQTEEEVEVDVGVCRIFLITCELESTEEACEFKGISEVEWIRPSDQRPVVIPTELVPPAVAKAARERYVDDPELHREIFEIACERECEWIEDLRMRADRDEAFAGGE